MSCVFIQNGNSALSIARRLGYISVVDTLKVVTEEIVTTQVRLCSLKSFHFKRINKNKQIFATLTSDNAEVYAAFMLNLFSWVFTSQCQYCF